MPMTLSEIKKIRDSIQESVEETKKAHGPRHAAQRTWTTVRAEPCFREE
jgi:hypothetical protein